MRARIEKQLLDEGAAIDRRAKGEANSRDGNSEQRRPQC